MIKQLRTNNQIRAAQVQVIDSEGKTLGAMSLMDAQKLAKEADLDLVEVGPNVVPPITKIMDYGKYMYQKERQEKKSGKVTKQRQEYKSVRVGFKTGAHDLAFKAIQAMKFLKEGAIVKLELTLRGREKGVAHIGRQKLEQFLARITDPYVIQEQIKRSPFGWVIVIKSSK